tara:strand:+ start:57 stop:509 length:453 start_codon:yes stop_codon:yes gene_type:complete
MNINKHFKYYYELDDDLQNLILSKIRYPQNKNLLEDIIDFKKSKDKIFEIYLNKGYDYDINNEFYIYYQIENDLMRYYNDDVAMMNGITETNIEKLERILCINEKMKKSSKSQIATEIMYKNNINVNMRINMLIGCLRINERENFINMFK